MSCFSGRLWKRLVSDSMSHHYLSLEEDTAESFLA